MIKGEIKQARAEMGLTQAKMASLLGISVRKWQRWECGTSPISSEGETLLKLLVEQHRNKQGVNHD